MVSLLTRLTCRNRFDILPSLSYFDLKYIYKRHSKQTRLKRVIDLDFEDEFIRREHREKLERISLKLEK